jgi:hypothetical protein
VVAGYLFLGDIAKPNRHFIRRIAFLFGGNNFTENKTCRRLDCLLLSKFIIRFAKIDGFDHAQPI